MAERALWGLHHAGGLGLVDEGVIRIGWVPAGELTDLPDDREAFKDRLRSSYPEKSEGWVANAAGQLLRFRYTIQVGDLVAYPQKSDRTVNVGVICGEYAYDPGGAKRYPHRRDVEWRGAAPREAFSQGCLYELGAAMSVFMVKTHRQELLEVVGLEAPGQPGTPAPGAEQEPLEPVAEADEPTAERIGEFTRDYILKTFNTELKGHGFAQFCGWLLETLGYTARVSPPGADRGVDIVATEDPLGVKRPLLKVQCKSGTGAVSSPEVQALNGTLADNELGLFIALGGFTPPARQVAEGMPKMRLLDADELVDLIFDHYSELADEAKEVLRLRRVWLPDNRVEGE